LELEEEEKEVVGEEEAEKGGGGGAVEEESNVDFKRSGCDWKTPEFVWVETEFWFEKVLLL